MRTIIPRRFDFTSCFVCGPDNLRGLHLVFEREANQVFSTFTLPFEYGGYGTVLHGGLTSTVLDEAMAWAVYGLLDRLSMTTSLHIQFIRPARCGEPLNVTGEIRSSDGQVAQAHAELRDAAGLLLAEGTGSMRFVSNRAIERIARGG